MTNPYHAPTIPPSEIDQNNRGLPTQYVPVWLICAGILTAIYYSQYALVSALENVVSFPVWLTFLLSALHVVWAASVLTGAWMLIQAYRRGESVLSSPGQWLIVWMASMLFTELVASFDLLLFGGTNFILPWLVSFLPIVVCCCAAVRCVRIWKLLFAVPVLFCASSWLLRTAWWNGGLENIVQLVVLGFCVWPSIRKDGDRLHACGIALLVVHLVLSLVRFAPGLMVIGYLPAIQGVQPV